MARLFNIINEFPRETTVICALARPTVRLSVRTRFVVAPTMAKHSIMAKEFQRAITATCARVRTLARLSARTKSVAAHTMARLFNIINEFPRETTVICALARPTVKLSVRTRFVVAPTMAKHSIMAKEFQRAITATCARVRTVARLSARTKSVAAHTMDRLFSTVNLSKSIHAINALVKITDRWSAPTMPADANTTAEPSISERHSTEMSATHAHAWPADSSLARTTRCHATASTVL